MLVYTRPEFNHDRYIHSVYAGSGIGSVFGKLVSRFAGKAASKGLRTAISTGSKIARKSLSTIAKKGLTATAMKSVARQTLNKGLRAGKAMARKQIKRATPKKVFDYAIKQSRNPKTQQMIQKAIVKGTKQLLPNNSNHPARENQFLREVAAETVKELTTPQPRKRAAAAAGKKRKAPRSTTVPKKRRRKRTGGFNTSNINSLIARS